MKNYKNISTALLQRYFEYLKQYNDLNRALKNLCVVCEILQRKTSELKQVIKEVKYNDNI